MGFLDIIERVKAYLTRQSRVSLRALQREFDLDDEAVEELVEELVHVQRVAVLDGSALALAPSPMPVGAPEAAAAHAVREASVAMSPGVPEAERRQLTVLFCDLVGSTALGQRPVRPTWSSAATKRALAAGASDSPLFSKRRSDPSTSPSTESLRRRRPARQGRSTTRPGRTSPCRVCRSGRVGRNAIAARTTMLPLAARRPA
jgi:FeoC like transcriptional regulator